MEEETTATQIAARPFWAMPWLWLALFLAAIAALLSLPLTLPIGANYWDLAVYLDGAHRLVQGQLPHRDFFAPVGGLGYALFWVIQMLAPQAHPLLVVQWSVLLLALPPLACVVAVVDRTSRLTALALLLPFLLFAGLPINGVELYPSPGFDAVGNYNRQACLLLYALTATLWLLPKGSLKLALAGWLLLALFGIKITGFVVGFGFVLHATLAGRVGWRGLAIMLAAMVVILAGLDLATGVVRAYLTDIASLIAMNSGSLLSRILTVASLQFDVLLGGGLLVCALALADWRGLAEGGVTAFLDYPAMRAGVALLGGIAFETQNTGSQEFIFLVPVFLGLSGVWWNKASAWRPVLVALMAMTLLPHAMKILHRGLRAIASAPSYAPLAVPELGPVGRVSAKPELLARAGVALAHQANHRPAYQTWADHEFLPSAILFSEIEFQLSWLKGTNEAIAALKLHEAKTGKRFNSLYTLDFVDLFAPSMRRNSPRLLPIGLDALRTFPQPDTRIMAELADIDGILVPTCPALHTRRIIAERFAPALAGRAVVELTPCWQLRPKP
jgi:hypothetical protein